jgi:methylated-DNA-[protein]-cysteine S-methyltransferase
MKLQKLQLKIQKIFLVSNLQTTYCKSPLGTTKIIGNENGIQSVSLLDEDSIIEDETSQADLANCMKNCSTQLKEYFAGTRTEFKLNLNPKGTEFQQKVWQELLNIPFNKTRSYLEQTKAIGDVKAIRAVASANGKNPIAIIIPCHRVIGSDGSLTGYASGLWRKKWLLAHENPVKQQSLF